MERYNSVGEVQYMVRVYPGTCAPDTVFTAVQATKYTTVPQLIENVVSKLSLDNAKDYYLAEVCQESGQNCIERKLGDSEYPVRAQLLWPKSPGHGPADPSYVHTKYRLFLRSIYQEHDTYSAFNDFTLDSFMSGIIPKVDEGEFDDLCNLPDLSEDTLTESIVARFKRGKIYTYVGSILISVNPFKFFPIYNPKFVNMYQNRRLGELPPHIFAIADAAFHTMLDKKKNQCVVISGESGSGKTEATNLLLHHLTALSRKGHASGLEQTILGAGPVLEAFGNAKTVVNNNSSRFGKFIQVNYRENGTVHGALVENYLLEKSRIVHLNPNERNYHVFYYLLAGATNAEKESLWLGRPDDYHYLNQNESHQLEGVDEVYEYSRLKQSMEMVGFSRGTMRRIFSVLSALLHLGNVEFRKKSDKEDGVTVKNVGLVKVISDLLKVKQETLLAALTTRKSVTRGDHFVVQYKVAEAVGNRDALAKCLYSALFDWIVLQVNHALMSHYEMKADHHGQSIGVLDIFGFEDFGKNSFEQFCINFANEHLQYYFNQHVFRFEQEEYAREGIHWDHIDFIDNTSCLNLLSRRPTGLFHVLDDDCNFPQVDTDGHNLVAKFDRLHHTHESFELPQVKEASFIIVHYAGKIKYQAKEFREKNNDLMRSDIVAVLKNSNMSFVRELIGADPVAVFRWAIVRAFFRSCNAFMTAGKQYRKRGGKPKSPWPMQQRSRSLPSEGNAFGDMFRVAQCYTLLRKINKSELDLHVIEPSMNQSIHTTTTSPQTSPGRLSPKKRKSQTNEGLLSIANEGSGSVSPSRYRTIYTEEFKKATKVMMKNKSFKPSSGPAKGLKDLKSFKKLVRRSLHSVRNSSKKVQTTVGSQFQISLSKLMEALNHANPFFVRCIKSNSEKEPCQLDEDLLIRQLKYTGMLETVRIRRAGYNVRLTFEEFCQHYKFLLPQEFEISREKLQDFLINMDLNEEHYQIGETKVFFRESERTKLQEMLHKEVLRRIMFIQRRVKAVLKRKRDQLLQAATITLQSGVRMFLAKRQLYRLKEQDMAACIIQCSWKTYKQRKYYLKLRTCIVWLQSMYRGRWARLKCDELRKMRRMLEEAARQRQLEEEMQRIEAENERKRKEDEERQLRQKEEENERKRQEEEEELKQLEVLSDEGVLTRDSSRELDDIEYIDKEMGNLSDESSGVIEMGSSESEEILVEDDVHIELDTGGVDEGTSQPVLIFSKSPPSSLPEIQTTSTPLKESDTSIDTGLKRSLSVTSPTIRHFVDEEDDRPKSGSIKVSEMAKAYQCDIKKKMTTPDRVIPRPERVASITSRMTKEPTEQEQELKPETGSKPKIPLSPVTAMTFEHAIQDWDTDEDSDHGKKPAVQPEEMPRSRLFWRRRKAKKHSDPGSGVNQITKPKNKTKGLAERRDIIIEGSNIARALPLAGFNVTSTSQWRYPTNKLISEPSDLKQMDDFLSAKRNEINQNSGKRDTIVDKVFKKAMQEYHTSLVTTYSVAMQDGQTVALKYKDLISNFESVLEHASRLENTTAQFPIIMGVNAFRGYLDEFMQIYKPGEQPTHSKKATKKKKKKNDPIEHLGHTFITSVFNIPTACEHCSSFLWLMEKGLLCTECNFVCHKKCYSKSTWKCRGRGQERPFGSGNLNDSIIGHSRIAPLVEKCISHMELKGLYTEGIYRKAGSEAKVKELKHRIKTTDLDSISFDDYNVFVIGQILKSYFRDLQHPLMSFELYDDFLRAAHLTNPQERIQSLYDVITKLPKANYDILERLMFHLARIALHVSSNKMSPQGLAIIFAPCLLRTNKTLPPLESLQHVAKQALVVECIISEQLKKLKSTLADLQTLEIAETTANQRLSTIQSLSQNRHHTSSGSFTEEDMDITTDEEEEQILSQQLKILQEEKEKLTARLPALHLHRDSGTSDDDMLSSDDVESLDNLDISVMNEEYAVTFDLPPTPMSLQHLNKRRPKGPSGKRPPSKYNKYVQREPCMRLRRRSPVAIIRKPRTDVRKNFKTDGEGDAMVTSNGNDNVQHLSGLLRDIDKVLDSNKKSSYR